MWLVSLLQENPELALFLTLAIGFGVGKIQIGSFKLGAVTGVLLTGVAMGQLNIVIDPTIKSVFFFLFLFILGYNVGPAFFYGLKKEGLPQVVFTLIVCLSGLFTTIMVSKSFGYHVGQASGLLAGALTQSSTIGVAQDAISNLSLAVNLKETYIDFVPIGYAVTYIFGTVGSALFLSTIAPKILKTDLIKECEELALVEEVQTIKKSKLDKIHKIETDVIFMMIGIFLGAIIGIPTLKIGSIALSLSMSGGVLLMGLCFGYLHAKKTEVGYIPKETAWFLQHVGLSVFVAVVGINAGPNFIAGLKTSGFSFLIAGVIVTSVPITIGLFAGKYLFKWKTSVLLGSLAGAMTSTASVGAICEKAQSNIPVVSYTIPYAVANIILTIWGSLIVLLY